MARNSRSTIRYVKISLLIAFITASLFLGHAVGFSPQHASAQSQYFVASQEAESQFPDGILFTIEASSPYKITQVKLLFHVHGQRSERYGNAEFVLG